MAAKIQYNVHTTNKYSVFDTDNSDEENQNKKLKEFKKREINSVHEDNTNSKSTEKKKLPEVKDVKPPATVKEQNAKKITTSNNYNNDNNDKYNKYISSSVNELKESNNINRSYRDNFHPRGNNIRSKFPRKRAGGGYSNSSTNILSNSNFYRGSRNYDYKFGSDRRNYNSSYNYNKIDYREKMFNEYNDSRNMYDSGKRESYQDSKNKNYEENINITRKHESVTIDYDLYRRQQEKKLISKKNIIADSSDKKTKKNEVNNEKFNTTSNNNTNLKRNDNVENEGKSDHPKRKAINVYQYILEEGGRVDRIPGFRRSYRNYKKFDEANWNNKMEGKTKIQMDEKILKKRDPPNINDTRAFPSLTSK
ncbi:hypothetical protein, conserved [Plasmodium gonderi]|uniref:Uncharacterized protein n=1 Tax=Plasmodium gonderi TaxID=77519 RepID=A0A1Y1JJF0_PLAGO|nr:hypothetical protein, conserved [Plasmodium gonderi]GAW82629.1 hypothetical protein, conserved [Plasmodium gonderi]